MDHFMEEVVVKRKNGINNLLYYLSWPAMIFAAIYAMILLQALLMGAVPLNVISIAEVVLNLAMALGIFLYHDRLRTEYEYTFTNGALDFAQVFNNKKRKNLGSLNVRTVDAFGKVSGKAFQKYLGMNGLKQYKWFLNRDAELYYFYFAKDNVKKLIVMEPSEELVAMVKTYVPRQAQAD